MQGDEGRGRAQFGHFRASRRYGLPQSVTALSALVRVAHRRAAGTSRWHGCWPQWPATAGAGTADRSRGLRWIINNPTMRRQMINAQEFARRLSMLGADAFTSDDVVDLATAADVRISADLEIDATVAQRLLDQISPALPVTGAQLTASQWPPPKSSRPAAPAVSFSSPGAVDGPADQPTRPRNSGAARSGRRPGSRPTGR